MDGGISTIGVMIILHSLTHCPCLQAYSKAVYPVTLSASSVLPDLAARSALLQTVTALLLLPPLSMLCLCSISSSAVH